MIPGNPWRLAVIRRLYRGDPEVPTTPDPPPKFRHPTPHKYYRYTGGCTEPR